MNTRDRFAGVGRLLTGVTCAVLLLALWYWGRDKGASPATGPAVPTTGDVAAVGRPAGLALPPGRAAGDPAPPRRPEPALFQGPAEGIALREARIPL
ncbi:hypothetical protein ACFYYH_06350 [Streptomyces sp. NPDC002018]|uniref:hypothetical protein n=1 Tax=Streptomyces sp. NPDC002018 TaxID=3364629 RepID=UPI00369857D6